MKIAVIGCGNVGSTLGRRWAENGHEVIYGVRDVNKENVKMALFESNAKAVSIKEAVELAEVVVYAAWWSAAEDICNSIGSFSNKVLIDCINPLKFGKGGLEGIELGFDTSASEKLQAWAKDARVVKCFNTASAQTMANPVIDGVKGDIYLCGNDEEARKTVATLAADLDFTPVDCGDLTAARYIEPMACLWIKLAFSGLGADFITKLTSRK